MCIIGPGLQRPQSSLGRGELPLTISTVAVLGQLDTLRRLIRASLESQSQASRKSCVSISGSVNTQLHTTQTLGPQSQVSKMKANVVLVFLALATNSLALPNPAGITSKKTTSRTPSAQRQC
ncbi:hypothetical protein SMMN14_03486 [Sphaerulina musiva]